MYRNKYNYGTIMTDEFFCNILQSLVSVLSNDVLKKS